MASPVPVAFYGFQLAPDVKVVTSDRSWQGWFEDTARPLIEQGVRVHHLHNPFGLHQVAGRGDRVMQVDQFDLSYCQGLRWLADRTAVAQVVRDIHDLGGAVHAYVGAPIVVRQPPQDTYLPKCSPGSTRLSRQVRLLSRIGACGSRLTRGCLCWGRLIGFHIDPLIDAGVDAIGFDASHEFHPGDCMDRLVRSLLARRIEVMIEPWPRKGRDYPPVNWIIRELLYQRIQLNPQSDEAPLDSVRGTIYRIVPTDTGAGFDERAAINEIRTTFNQQPFNSSQEIVDAVRGAGHIPVVRARQLASGEVT
jgi:hypothetical protein